MTIVDWAPHSVKVPTVVVVLCTADGVSLA